MNENNEISMVIECTDSYNVKNWINGGIEINIRIPKRFACLWIEKLSDLQTTMQEIKDNENETIEFTDGKIPE